MNRLKSVQWRYCIWFALFEWVDIANYCHIIWIVHFKWLDIILHGLMCSFINKPSLIFYYKYCLVKLRLLNYIMVNGANEWHEPEGLIGNIVYFYLLNKRQNKMTDLHNIIWYWTNTSNTPPSPPPKKRKRFHIFLEMNATDTLFKKN